MRTAWHLCQAENETSLTLEQIETLRHNAVEENEKKEIFGNHILIRKNILLNWRYVLFEIEALGWVLNYRDLIISFMLSLFAFFVQMRVKFAVMDYIFYVIAVAYICVQLFMNHERFLYYKTTIYSGSRHTGMAATPEYSNGISASKNQSIKQFFNILSVNCLCPSVSLFDINAANTAVGKDGIGNCFPIRTRKSKYGS